jgi:hypothetical protein
MFPLVKNTKERRIRAIVPFLPLAFIAATALSIVMYHVTLNSSIKSLQHEFRDIAYHTLTSTGGVDPNDNRLSAGVLGITGHVDYDILEGLTVFSPTTLLKGIRFNKIPLGGVLIAFYIGIFIFAEAAFLTMAMKEYLQDVLQLSDQDLIRRKA